MSEVTQAARPASGAAVPTRPALRVPPLWLLGLITASGTVGMHILIPSLPEMAAELGVSPAATQQSVTLYLIGLSLGQLIYGPLSDRFGRRPVLMAGLGLSVLAGAACGLAPGLGLLLPARFMQAIGGCSGLVLGRAIVRDIAGPREAAARLALLNLVLTVSPGIAPVVGGWIATFAGWRAIFGLLVVMGLATILLAFRLLPETRAGQGQGPVTAAGVARPGLLASYRRLLRQPAFLGYSIAGACATSSMYGFFAVSAFVFVDQVHRPAHEVGYYYLVLIFGVSLGSIVINRLARLFSIDALLRFGTLFGAAGAALFLVAAATGHLSVLTVMVPMFIFTIGAGLASPMALTRAVSVDPTAIGAAAGLYGAGQMAVGALCTWLAGFGHNPSLAAALVLTAGGVIGQAALMVAARYTRPRES
jgi:DHA1 family bicyclomycin/chloramphenicol resistance-like MFS transporter